MNKVTDKAKRFLKEFKANFGNQLQAQREELEEAISEQGDTFEEAVDVIEGIMIGIDISLQEDVVTNFSQAEKGIKRKELEILNKAMQIVEKYGNQ